MKKMMLLSPGPTAVPDRVLKAMSEATIHHRTSVFEEVFAQAREGLKKVFQVSSDVLILASSGTGAMEASVSNFFRKTDTCVYINGGKFGERWGEILRAYGVNAIEISVEWGRAAVVEEVASIVEKEKPAGLFFQASETSTGVRHPTQEITKAVKEVSPDTLIVVDGITGVGVFDIRPEEWGLDVLVSGSQKAFMLPPGLSFLWASEKAWERANDSDLPCYYFDLKKEKKQQAKNQTAYTPAIGLVLGLKESVSMILEEGLENVFNRHAKLARAARECMKALSLELFSEVPAEGLTAVKSPADIDGQKVVKHMRETYGVVIAGGQSHLKGKIFRVAHMGYVFESDLLAGLAALEHTLHDLGYPVEFGKGVGAAEKSLAEG